MASITKTKAGTWKAVIRKLGWPAAIKTFRTRLDATDWARRTEDEMVRGIYIDRAPAERLTLNADGQHFDGTWTADDSEYFVEQISGTIRSVERTKTVLQPYDCEPMVVVGNR